MRFPTLYRVLPRLSMLAGIVVLAGCATMSPEECLVADWYKRGARDGQNGQPRSYIESHRKACAKAAVMPDSAAYLKGWAAGIRNYCTPENGMHEGRRGRSYRNACPGELQGGFLDRYYAGYRVYQAEQRVSQLDSQLRSKETELRKAKDDKARSRLRRDLRDLDHRIRRARDDVYHAEHQARW